MTGNEEMCVCVSDSPTSSSSFRHLPSLLRRWVRRGRKTHFPTGHWIHITEHFIWQIKIRIEIPFWFIWSLRKVVGAEALGRTFRASLSKWMKNNFEILRQAKWALFVLQLWKSKKQFKWRLLMRHFNLKLLADVAIMQMCKINVSIV